MLETPASEEVLSEVKSPKKESRHTKTEQCPHCERTFNFLTAQRHIPHCAKTKAKPKPPPSKQQQQSLAKIRDRYNVPKFEHTITRIEVKKPNLGSMLAVV